MMLGNSMRTGVSEGVFGSNGLVAVPEATLVQLLRAVHRGELDCPITRPGLASVGLLGRADDFRHLLGLERAAVIAVLVAVIAERRR